jgi:hypothetical protein
LVIGSKKSQITLEGILVSFIAMFLIVSLVNLQWDRFYLARETGEAGEIRMVGELLAQGINTAYANGKGFSLYIPPELLNYSRMQALEPITGLGLGVITVNTSSRSIILSKGPSRTGGTTWNISMEIIPQSIARLDPTPEYKETTIYNNGTAIIIYASSGNIRVI